MSACRICLGDSNLMDIFGSNEDIASSIMLFASVQIFEDDSFPQQICNLCKTELNICRNFKYKCETTFKTLLASSEKIKVDKIEARIEGTNYEMETEIDSENYSEMPSEGTNTECTANTNCKKCNIHFPSETSFIIHLEMKHMCVCRICHLHCGDRNELFQHLKIEHKVLPLGKSKQCDICGKCFMYNAELRRHILTHSGAKKFKCDQCDKHFTSRGGLNKHVARHSKISSLTCPLCPKKFTHQSNLSDHIKVHSNQRKYSCHICSKNFKAKRTLVLHLKVHRNERDFPCIECDKAFTNKYDLVRHEKLHERFEGVESGIYQGPSTSKGEISGNGKQCEFCGRCCRNVSDLKKHIRVHTGERPYICLYCEKTFKSTSSLNCHIRIHTKEKPYACRFCGKDFAQSSNLRTHETIHSAEKPFKCCICFNSFSRKRDLQRHLEKCDEVKI